MIAACQVLLLQPNCLAVILVSQYGIEDISFDSGAGSHDVDRGTQQFRCLSASCDDVLGWWLQQSGTFPRLRQLERAVMCVPATSAPAESFSVTGLFMNAKRSSLPLYTRMNKIMFSHDIDRLTVLRSSFKSEILADDSRNFFYHIYVYETLSHTHVYVARIKDTHGIRGKASKKYRLWCITNASDLSQQDRLHTCQDEHCLSEVGIFARNCMWVRREVWYGCFGCADFITVTHSWGVDNTIFGTSCFNSSMHWIYFHLCLTFWYNFLMDFF